MSTLARLRDLAGCRVVLRDAQEEQRPPEMIADLERVRQEAEDALWDGGQCALGFAMAGSSLVVRRVAPRRPDVSESAFHDAVYNFDADGEDTHAAWAVEMIAEWKSAVRRFQQSDLLAWRGQPRRQRSGMPGVDLAGFADILREVYAEGPSPLGDVTWLEARLPDRVHPALAMTTSRPPNTVVMSPRNWNALQREAARALVRRVRERYQPPVDDELAKTTTHVQASISDMHRSLARAANPADVFGDGREWTRSLVPAEPRTAGPDDSDGIEIRMRSYANFVTPWVGVIDPT